jgi:hypothetical protein
VYLNTTGCLKINFHTLQQIIPYSTSSNLTALHQTLQQNIIPYSAHHHNTLQQNIIPYSTSSNLRAKHHILQQNIIPYSTSSNLTAKHHTLQHIIPYTTTNFISSTYKKAI